VNLAFEIGGDLCPRGIYGYDPRCDDWFAIGKNMTVQPDVALYVAPPKIHFGSQIVASTAASPLIDPENQNFVGLTLMQFSNQALSSALETSDVDFSFVITPTSNFLGGDTVVASNQTLSSSMPIQDVILPFDKKPNSTNRLAFTDIIASMKMGMSGNSTITRTESDGAQETSLLVYTPVNINSSKAAHPNDYSRGIIVSQTHVYSIAVASDWKDINRSFDQIQAHVVSSLRKKGWIYTSLIFSIFLVVCGFTSMASE
jgi:hypothetical protein